MRFRQDYQPPEPAPEQAQARAPWDQIPHEPPEAFALFVRYLTDPAGSVAGFIRAQGLLVGPTLTQAARWRWVARRVAYDRAIAQASAQAAQETAQERGRAHALYLTDALGWAHESIEARRASGEILEPRDIAAFGKLAIELQRLRDGEATQRTAIDLTGATPEALAALESALTQVEQGSAQAGRPASSEPAN